jgi:hypothetical protein
VDDNDQLSIHHKELLDFVKDGDFDGAYVVAFKVNAPDEEVGQMMIESSGFTLKDGVDLCDADLEHLVSAALHIAMRTCMEIIGEEKTKEVIIRAAASKYEDDQRMVH